MMIPTIVLMLLVSISNAGNGNGNGNVPNYHEGWTHCANENGHCSCDGAVRYGHGSSWVFGRGSTHCSNSVFGDPKGGTTKNCYCAAHAGGWSYCANENGLCTCNGAVRYGHGDSWNFKSSHGTIGCDNGVFGDPKGGTTKKCYCAPTNGRRRLDICEGSKTIMGNLSNLHSKSSCADVHSVMKAWGRKWLCSFMSSDKNANDLVENMAKFPGLFNGEYTSKCPDLKIELENWKSTGDILSSRIGAALDQATFKLHHEKFSKLVDPEAIKYNLYIVLHEANHMSAYFEEPRTCLSESSHYVFQTVSWGTKYYFKKLFAEPENVIKHMHKAYLGVPGKNLNVFNNPVAKEILRFQFPLGQMHKVLRFAPAAGDIWDILDNSCAAKIFHLVKRAFELLGTADITHSYLFYEPEVIFGFLKKLANEAPNGYVLNDEERDAIVDDAFAYGVKNWADTFDEPIESLPSRD